MIYNEDLPFQNIVIPKSVIDQIIADTGSQFDDARRDDFNVHLNDCISLYLTARYFNNQLTPVQIVERFNNINKAARRLLKELGEKGGVIPLEITAFLNRGRADKGLEVPIDAKALIQSLYELSLASSRAASVAKTKVGTGKSNHEGDKTLDQLFGSFAGIWIKFYGGLPTMSYDDYTSKINGEFFVFVNGMLQAMNQALTNEMIVNDPKIKSALSPTPAAIYSRWQRTGIQAGISKIKKSIR